MTEIGPEKAGFGGAVQRLMAGAGAFAGRGPAPVHLWNPPFCGDIDMRISADGRWHYNGSPINRPAMVKLFATILRKDSERYVLVTPVERVGIRVDDAPFVAVEVAVEPSAAGDRLFFRTNLDEIIEAGREHPLRFEVAADGGLKPYIHVRGDLWALASRALTHELIGMGHVELMDEAAMLGGDGPGDDANQRGERRMFGVRSGAVFFPLAPADDVA